MLTLIFGPFVCGSNITSENHPMYFKQFKKLVKVRKFEDLLDFKAEIKERVVEK